MAYTRREYPEWSWSLSRARTFEECRRRYYYHYYSAHNGWEAGAPAPARLAYRLKQLTNLYFVLGDALHRVARLAVESARSGGEAPTVARLEQAVRDRLNHAYRSSRDRDGFIRAPNRVVMLHDFYYGRGPSRSTIERVRARIAPGVANLLGSESFRAVTRPPLVPLLECEAGSSFDYSGLKVYAVPDLLYVDTSGHVVVVDWKSGEEDESHPEQLALYALYAHRAYGYSPARIVGRLEYLTTGHGQEVALGAADLERAEALIARSSRAMQEYLADSARNVPLPRERFALAGDRTGCGWCNFYELCAPDLGPVEG